MEYQVANPAALVNKCSHTPSGATNAG